MGGNTIPNSLVDYPARFSAIGWGGGQDAGASKLGAQRDGPHIAPLATLVDYGGNRPFMAGAKETAPAIKGLPIRGHIIHYQKNPAKKICIIAYTNSLDTV